MNSLTTDRVIDIQRLVSKFREIKRVTYNPGGGYENDVEHSYGLAFMALLMAPKVVPDLNLSKLISMALVHDLVEVYAGDTFCFASNEELISKQTREANAFERIKVEYSDFENLIDLIAEYELRKTEEARFIYALDKLQGVIINYIDGGRVWREESITFEKMVANKLAKTRVHPAVHEHMKNMVHILAQDETLFPTIKLYKQNFAMI